MLGRRPSAAYKGSLISRYSETLGELMLRRHTELAMRAAKVESDRASGAKSAFLATMSHELRTPLNAIIGFSDLIKTLRDEPGSVEKSINYASDISTAGRHLLQVMSDILDISKIESGAFKLNLETRPIGEIIEASVAMVAGQMAARHQRFELRLDPDLPSIPIDARRIKQILINLLSNANKYTPDHGQILVVARRNPDGGATIAVVDTGVGMTEEQQTVAMTPFGQVQSYYTRTQEGTGLGLPIARGLAREHGGDLYLKSEPDVGTAAVVTLPPVTPEHPSKPVSIFAGAGERRSPREQRATSERESRG